MELYQDHSVWKREDFAPLSFWAWNEEMSDESIAQRIREFHEQKFQGFFMHARAGLLTPYLSDEWFHACRTAADVAEKYGMKAWIYDEDGWPSGFGGGRVNGLGEAYVSKSFEFTREKPTNRKYVIASYEQAPHGMRLCEFDRGILWAVYHTEENYVDLLSEKVTKAFLELIYERYKKELGDRLGSVVPGFFTDEPQYFREGYPYSFEIGSYFEARNHYRMEDRLYQLMPAQPARECRQFRLDFWNTVEEMMRENFCGRIYRWCEENHVVFTGHFPGEDSLIQQITSTAGVMPKYAYQQIPGIDHLGNRITSLLLTKQVTSVAKQQGKKRILSETFGCAGWNISFEEMCYLWAWQASAGINMPVLHLGAHSIRGRRKRDYPAYYSYQEPWWDGFHHVSDWLSGIGYEMSKGKWVEDIVVISPMQSIYCCHGDTINYTVEEKAIAASYRNLCDSLRDLQLGFDLGDEALLRNGASVKNGFLQIGKCGYRYVIIPKATLLLSSTWDLLKAFYKGGGTLIFTESIPEGGGKWAEQCPVVQNSLRFWGKYFKAFRYRRRLEVYEKEGFSLAKDLFVSIKEDGDTLHGCVGNLCTDSSRELLLSVPGLRYVEKIDPETLKRSPLSAENRFDGEETFVSFRLKGRQIMLLEARKQTCEAPVPREDQCSVWPVPAKFARTSENAFAIDKAAYSFDGLNYSAELPVVFLPREIYANADRNKQKKLYVRYRFLNQLSGKTRVHAAVEDKDCLEVTCNGNPVTGREDGWYLDRGIGRYDITERLQPGPNRIAVTYRLDTVRNQDVSGLFETEVNRFFYPVEPEAIYLLGDFSVSTGGQVLQKRTHLRLVNPNFSLLDTLTLDSTRDVTPQGLWFYRGNLKAEFSLEFCGNEKVFLQITNPKAAFVEVACNQKSVALFAEPYRVEIDGLLRAGTNRVSVILHGTNRNLLGPHHHTKGENRFVGCNTFCGIKGYEDSFFNFDIDSDRTWTDDYSFVSFGCDAILVLREPEG